MAGASSPGQLELERLCKNEEHKLIRPSVSKPNKVSRRCSCEMYLASYLKEQYCRVNKVKSKVT